MSRNLLRSPGCLVYIVLVACYAAFLANSVCYAQFLIDNGGGLGVLPPGLRLSQTLQQGGFGLPRPAIFGSSSFDTLSAPAPPDGVAGDTAAPDAAAEQPDLAEGPPPPPPPVKVSPPPPPPAGTSTARGRRNNSLNTTTSAAPAPAPGPKSAPAPAPGLLAAGNTTAVSFSELIASAALAPAPHGVAPLLAPGPQPAAAANASSATAQPTQIKDLLAPEPAGAQTSPAAAAPQGSPSGGSREDPRTKPQSGRSEPGTCAAQGLSGQCNACVCCCIPNGSGGFWRYVPSGSCDCAKVVSKPDIWTALALLGITVLPALLWAAYFAEALKISPYKPCPQRLPVAAHPAAQHGH